MKRYPKVFTLFMYITLLAPSAAQGQQTQPSQAKQLFQTLRAKTLGSLQAARSILTQKTKCLINYDACTKQDKLAISTAFGFTLGYGISYKPLLDQLFKKLKIEIDLSKEVTAYQIAAVAIIANLAREWGLTGPAFVKPNVKQLGTLLTDYLNAADKQQWIAQMKNALTGNRILMKSLLIFFIIADAIPILQEIAYAVRYEDRFPVVSIAKYLKMNVQCIWNENNCKPEKNAESRRIGLYFWLGYLQGYIARELKSRYYLTLITRITGRGNGGYRLGSQ